MVSRETFSLETFFDLSQVWFADFFVKDEPPWAFLTKDRKENWIRSRLKENVSGVKRNGSMILETAKISAGNGFAVVEAGSYLDGNEIELRAGVHVEAGAWLTGPTILGERTTVRHGAYVRGGVLTGTACVVGHASEIKSSILLNTSKAPHFAYVGDSILGNNVNLGAGTKVSNLKITGDEIVLRLGNEEVPSGLKKMGAIVGDGTETGCNSVLSPGVLLGMECRVYPAMHVRKNYYPKGTFVK